jgi:CRISPR-associated exonuclease Cas4
MRESESDLVALGALLQESTYSKTEKDILIDQKISIDFIRKGEKIILHEIKKSSKLEKAHEYQMLYYLYYLKNFKNVEAEGVINYPKSRKVKQVILSPEKEEEIRKILDKIKQIVSLPKPPKPEYKKYCRKCSYFEFCWSE